MRGPNIVPPLNGFLSSMVVVRKWSQAMNVASNNALWCLNISNSYFKIFSRYDVNNFFQ